MCTRSSGPGAFHYDGARHHVVHSPVVLEEEEGDERREEEGDGEILVQGSDRRPMGESETVVRNNSNKKVKERMCVEPLQTRVT